MTPVAGCLFTQIQHQTRECTPLPPPGQGAVAAYPQLLDLGVDVALGEVLDVGELQVHLRQPHQDAVLGRLKLLPLADEVLGGGREQRSEITDDTMSDG